MNNRKRRAIKLAKVREIDERITDYKRILSYSRNVTAYIEKMLWQQSRLMGAKVSYDGIERAKSWSINQPTYELFKQGMPEKRHNSKIRLEPSFYQHERYANYRTNGTFITQ